MQKIAISIGDINGVGLEIALKSHKDISSFCQPIYCINRHLLKSAATLLNLDIPNDFNRFDTFGNVEINPGKISKDSGEYSFNSFIDAVTLAKEKKVDAIVTLPINKKSWEEAGVKYVGHTDALRDIFKTNAIMMLGCEKMFVALYTEHIPLKTVAKFIKTKKLTQFLIDFYNCIKNADDTALHTQDQKIAVLGLNPHAGDDGVLGSEDSKIKKAILNSNKNIRKDIFEGPLVPDIAFTPNVRKNYKYFIAMYHDQGLAPLKALYFDEGINVSLNLPIIRTSVDHGTAFNIAYTKENISTSSYINAVKEAVKLSTC